MKTMKEDRYSAHNLKCCYSRYLKKRCVFHFLLIPRPFKGCSYPLHAVADIKFFQLRNFSTHSCANFLVLCQARHRTQSYSVPPNPESCPQHHSKHSQRHFTYLKSHLFICALRRCVQYCFQHEFYKNT